MRTGGPPLESSKVIANQNFIFFNFPLADSQGM